MYLHVFVILPNQFLKISFCHVEIVNKSVNS